MRPLFTLIKRSWHVYPLGLLFGLGFDTATEVGLLGISAAQAAHGLSIWSILVFPALFTAGMSLMDTTDSTVMVGTYGWAFVKPIRKLHYNMTITFASVVAALVIGSIEALGLIGDRFGLDGPVWRLVAMLGYNSSLVGYMIVAFLVISWFGPICSTRQRAMTGLMHLTHLRSRFTLRVISLRTIRRAAPRSGPQLPELLAATENDRSTIIMRHGRKRSS